MEIVSKITEEKLVWEIFTYVAESPLTKEKNKLLKKYKFNNRSLPHRKFKIKHALPSLLSKEIQRKWTENNGANHGRNYFEPHTISKMFPLFKPDEYFPELDNNSSDVIDRNLYDAWSEIILPTDHEYLDMRGAAEERGYDFHIHPEKAPMRYYKFLVMELGGWAAVRRLLPEWGNDII